EVVTFALAAIVFAQRDLQRRERFDFRARSVSWLRAGDVVHQFVDVLELPERRPPAITSPPLQTRSQPDGKGFGEVLRRVCLCVPGGQVQNIFATLGSWFV